MAKQRLTDRQLISGITLTDLLHFVITGDTSQNPAGSSYKGTVTQLFDAFSSYTCTNPLIVDTVNACDSGITINGNVTINGSATTINTEVIQSKDNNIILNYSGNHTTALWGGITVEDGQSEGVDSLLYIDADGCWHADPGFCDLTVDGVAFTAQTPYLFVDDGSINSITTRYTGNTVTDSDYSNIGGGKDNTIESNISGGGYSNIAGGLNNLIDDYRYSVIGGGNSNQILGGECFCNSNVIVGGEGNTIDVSVYSSIVGGKSNTIYSSNLSFIGGGKLNTVTKNYGIIIGGSGNTNNGYNATIINGYNNIIDSDHGIVGGYSNSLTVSNSGSGWLSTILNGRYNTIDSSKPFVGSYLSILGGAYNTIDGGVLFADTIVSGYYNHISGKTGTNFIGGGYYNQIISNSTPFSLNTTANVIVGGSSNKIVGEEPGELPFGQEPIGNVIVGGRNNYMRSKSGFGDRENFIGSGRNNYLYNSSVASIVGGESNRIENSIFTTIGGGRVNIIYDNTPDSSIVGGYKNKIYGNGDGRGFIGGGYGNIVNIDGWAGSSIVGGFENKTTKGNNFIGDGDRNTIDAAYSSIVGGKQNHIIFGTNNYYSFIGGGYNNNITGTTSFIGGGKNNNITSGGTYSSIIGGENNTVNHINSHIIGSNITSISANTTHVERFNIGTVDTGSTATEVLVRETNGMVNTTPLSAVTGGLSGKYVELITGYTANVTQTITHNLGTGDEVVADVIDTTNNERISSVIDNYQTNALDLTLSQNYASIKIVIIG